MRRLLSIEFQLKSFWETFCGFRRSFMGLVSIRFTLPNASKRCIKAHQGLKGLQEKTFNLNCRIKL